MTSSVLPDPFPALMPVYAQTDVMFERGEGSILFDTKGQRYLDFVGGIAVVGLGHAHPAIVAALKAQAEKLWCASNLFKYPSTQRLAERLIAASFADTVFFQNSGAEAWECCVKVIRKYFSTVGENERKRIISIKGCFHGRTMAAISASKTDKMIKGFEPILDGFDQVEWGNLDAVRTAISPKTAAICIEPVQGEGGLRVASKEYLQGLRRLCDDYGMLLFFDEVQCGMGRTGRLFAYEHSGVRPDVMCLAKALGNGYPIGACLATKRAAQGMTAGTHGSTYGGNPMATTIGNAVLDVMSAPSFFAEVARKGALLEGKLEELIAKHPKVFIGRRGMGMMQGLICGPANTDVIKALLAQRMLVVAAGDNVVRMLPPLTTTDEQIAAAVDILSRVATQFEQEVGL
jgi:acetylornithine/N-succinyldiaminopimelate aminotransferase